MQACQPHFTHRFSHHLCKNKENVLSQKAEKRCPKWPTPARVLHGSCTEDMVVLLQTRLPCPECQPASATTQQQAFLSDGSGHCSLCCSTATNQPTRQVTLSFNSPYKRANFRDDFLVYDHTTGKTPVLVLLHRTGVKSEDFLVKNLPSIV